MSATNPKTVYDGFLSLDGGADSGRVPNLIERNKVSFAINARFRGGFAHPRPPHAKVPLSFGGDAAMQARFEDGRFQVAEYFDPDSGDSVLVASIGGRLFRINVATDNSVQEITLVHNTTTTMAFTVPAVGSNVPVFVVDASNIFVGYTITINGTHFTVEGVTGNTINLKNVDANPTDILAIGSVLSFFETNPAHIQKGWMVQAEKWLVVRDGQSIPLIYNGATVRRAAPNEIKPGRAMTYGMGRIWGVGVDDRTFRAGDLVFGSSGTVAEGFADAVLKETENIFLNGGGNFTTPSNSGGIKALRFMATLDTALGQGPLQVFTPNQVFSVNAPTDRTEWQNLQNPIQTISQVSDGALSQNSTQSVNGDLFYRSKDGIRSFILAVRQFGGWGNTPMSTEMARVLERDDRTLLEFASAIVFDNRFLITCSPVFTQHGVYHRGLIALDFDLISGMRKKLPPAYDGLWTGLNVLQLVKGDFNGRERAFAFTLNADSKIELYELGAIGLHDNGNTPINWILESRLLPFPSRSSSGEMDRKRLMNGEAWIDRLSGQADFDIKFRPDQYPCWVDWKTFSECAKSECFDVDPITGCLTVQEFREQYRPRLGFGQPPDTCDNVLGRPYREFFEVQVRLSITGFCRLKKLRLLAHEIEEAPWPETAGC